MHARNPAPDQMNLEAAVFCPVAETVVDDVPNFATLLRYWKAVRGERDMPTRADIDPVALKELLGWLFIVEHRPGPDDFYYRLIGSAITGVHGREYTSKTVAEVLAPMGQEVALGTSGAYRRVIDEIVSFRSQGRLVWSNKSWVIFDSLHLPLRGDAGQGDMVLGIMDFGRLSSG